MTSNGTQFSLFAFTVIYIVTSLQKLVYGYLKLVISLNIYIRMFGLCSQWDEDKSKGVVSGPGSRRGSTAGSRKGSARSSKRGSTMKFTQTRKFDLSGKTLGRDIAKEGVETEKPVTFRDDSVAKPGEEVRSLI